MKLKRKNKVATGIPTASLPDIIFMLLIFFMVATVLKQFTGLKVKVPDAELVKKIPGSKRHVVTIWIDKNNERYRGTSATPGTRLRPSGWLHSYFWVSVFIGEIVSEPVSSG